ncbi:DUF4913 domain-containing protein [Streptomyces sp. BE230]|uniref:DUF4913 domain-containing protein n=1 Tax=Streptomyces sp. BE230 TaxID=3002526 RepID=UPI002ED01A82|nr:DUF4913 domain-containing protein [Streptomyces sp. BE230]
MPRQQQGEGVPAGGDTAAPAMGTPPPMETDDSTELVFRSVDAFYDEYLCQVVRRRVDGVHLAWCPDWWSHPEAIARIATLWRAFEHLRLDPALGMSHWWLHHADPHLAVLMDPRTGPFTFCAGPDGHSAEIGPLPGNPSPPEMWDHPAFSLDAAEAADAEAEAKEEEEAGTQGPGQ